MPVIPRIAVILRVRRTSESPSLAVRSFLAQTWRAWELVFVGVDAKPMPDAVRDPRVRHSPVIVRTGNWAAALNRAVASIESPYIAFADSTALAAPERLDAQSQFLSRHSRFDFVSGWSELLSEGGSSTRHTFSDADPDTLLAALLHENPFSFGTVMITRACFEALNGFDERLQAGVDHDLWLRIGGCSRLAVHPGIVCKRVPEDLAVLQEDQTSWILPERRRRDHVRRVLESHPRGRWILEEALSRYPEDDLLWRCHSRFRARRDAQGSALVHRTPGDADVHIAPDVSLLSLRCLRSWGNAAPFNALARRYRRLGNPLLEYLCQLRSLAIDPRQPSLLGQAYSAWFHGVTQATGFSAARAANVSVSCTASVLIATYNRAHLFRETIESVLTQTLRDLELVIVDDGSTDDTEHVLSSFNDPRIRYVRTEHRGVPAAALNTAAYHARGRYLAYLGDDDVYYPDHLACLVGALETSGASLVYSRQRNVWGHHEHGRFVRELELGIQGRPDDEGRLRGGRIISPQSVLHRRESLVAVGGFDERLPTFEDWDLWVRISERFRATHWDGVTVEYRKHGGNMSRRRPVVSYLRYALLRNYYASFHGLAILLRAAQLQGRVQARERLLTALKAAGSLRRGGRQ